MAFNDLIKLYNKTKGNSNICRKLFSDSDFSDVTLVCGDNQHLPAHRAVLCASSTFLRQLLYDSQQQRTFLYLGPVPYQDMLTLLELVYLGHCSVQKDRLGEVEAVAAGLGITLVLEGKEEERKECMMDLEERDEVTVFPKEGGNVNETHIYENKDEDYKNDVNKLEIVGKEDQIMSDSPVFLENGTNNEEQLMSTDTDMYLLSGTLEVKCNNLFPEDLCENPYKAYNDETISSSHYLATTSDNKPVKDRRSEIPEPDINGRYKCDMCDFVSKEGNVGKQSYGRHRVTHHGYKGFRLPRTEIPEPDINGRYRCDMCAYVSREGKGGKHSYRRHRVTKHEGFSYSCNICYSSFKTRSQLTDHNNFIHEGVLFECKECSKQFSAKKYLVLHQERKKKCKLCDFFSCCKIVFKHFSTEHNTLYDNGLYKCDQCSYDTTKQQRINQHVKYAHNSTLLVCDQCLFRTKIRYELKAHRQEKHLGITYQCDQCENSFKEFPSKKILFAHKVKEHGLRNFPCKDCDYVGKSESKRAYHREIKHPHDDYICSECKMKFASRNTLLRHGKHQHTNEPKACDKCSYVGKNKALLSLHVKTKHSHIVHQCTKCPFKAKLKPLMKSHELAVHEGVSFDCEKCGKKMISLKSLKNHRKNFCGKNYIRKLTITMDENGTSSICESKDCCRLSI